MLTYMATCRRADKKPCDNIPNDPTIPKLADTAISNVFGGGMTKNALNELVGRTNAFEEASNFLDTPAVKAACRTNAIASAATSATCVSAASDLASRAVTATFMVEPIGLGKDLCPSAG